MVGFFVFMITSLIDYRWIRFGALPMYVSGCFSGSNDIYRNKGVRVAQLASFGSD